MANRVEKAAAALAAALAAGCGPASGGNITVSPSTPGVGVCVSDGRPLPDAFYCVTSEGTVRVGVTYRAGVRFDIPNFNQSEVRTTTGTDLLRPGMVRRVPIGRGGCTVTVGVDRAPGTPKTNDIKPWVTMECDNRR